MNKVNIALLFGGRSDEHSVSIISTKYVYSLLLDFGHNVSCFYFDKENKVFPVSFNDFSENRIKVSTNEINLSSLIKSLKDKITFPINYGKCAEDGKLYGFLELYNITTIGGNYNSYVLTFDKLFTKFYLSAKKLPTPEYKHYSFLQSSQSEIVLDIIKEFKKPIIIKPRGNGSSIGMTLVKQMTKENLNKAITEVEKYDTDFICEYFISNFREFQISVIQSGSKYYISKAVELKSNSEFLDYNEKFSSNNTLTYQYLSETENSIISKMKEYSLQMMKELQIKHFSRMDFLLDPENNKLYINEISPMFGMMKKSAFWQLWRNTNFSDIEVLNLVLSDFNKQKI